MDRTPALQFRIPLPFDEAEQAVRQALQGQGFGILTEVDVATVFREKLGIESRPQKLLGACNPQLAHQSLQAEPAVGAFLPCGVAIREGASAQETIVALQNPALLADVFGVSGLAPAADEALKRLRAALEAVGSPV